MTNEVQIKDLEFACNEAYGALKAAVKAPDEIKTALIAYSELLRAVEKTVSASPDRLHDDFENYRLQLIIGYETVCVLEFNQPGEKIGEGAARKLEQDLTTALSDKNIPYARIYTMTRKLADAGRYDFLLETIEKVRSGEIK